MCVFVGSTLITVGEYQKRLGGAERDLLQASAVGFLTPLRNFLEGDWRTISVRLFTGSSTDSLATWRRCVGFQHDTMEEQCIAMETEYFTVFLLELVA